MDPKATDPVIIDLLQWLGENLPGVAEEDIFKQVQKLEKHSEGIISRKLEELKEIVALNEETRQKTKKLEKSRAKLDLKKEQYKLVTSIKLDSCMDLISRYNHLMAKK